MLHVKDIKIKILIYICYIILLIDNKIKNYTKFSSNNMMENANKEIIAILERLIIVAPKSICSKNIRICFKQAERKENWEGENDFQNIN